MKDKIAVIWSKIKSRQDKKLEKEFLPEALEIVEKPSSPLGHFAVWIITLMLIVFFVWSVIGRVDEIAFARGKINSVDGLQIIQPLNGGKVVDICVKEGEYVTAGQTIMQLDASSEEILLNSKKEALDTLEYQNSILNEVLSGIDISGRLSDGLSDDKVKIYEFVLALCEDYESKKTQADLNSDQIKKQLDAQNEALAKAQINIDLLKERKEKWDIVNSSKGPEKLTLAKLDTMIETAEKEVQDYKELYESGAISKYELDSKTNQLNELINERNIQKARADVEDVEQLDTIDSIQGQIDVSQKEYDMQASAVSQIKDALSQAEEASYNIKAEHLKNISNLIVQNNSAIAAQKSEYELQIQNYESQTLVSPVNGTVQTLAVNTIGGVVTSAQPIATIVPENTQLIMEADLLNKDVGFVKVGQEVIVKLDTFPYQKYGKISGKVIYISPDAVRDEQKGLIYKVKIALDTSEIRTEEELAKITVGMEGTAEIKVSDRRIIEFFLEPLIEHLDSSLKVR